MVVLKRLPALRVITMVVVMAYAVMHCMLWHRFKLMNYVIPMFCRKAVPDRVANGTAMRQNIDATETNGKQLRMQLKTAT